MAFTVVVSGVIVANDPPKVAVLIADKPTTVRVTFVPAIPDIGVVVRVGAPSIVNVAIALSVGVPKVRLTVYTPAGAFGTVNFVVPTNRNDGNAP